MSVSANKSNRKTVALARQVDGDVCGAVCAKLKDSEGRTYASKSGLVKE